MADVQFEGKSFQNGQQQKKNTSHMYIKQSYMISKCAGGTVNT